jgi:hypothetical protein
VNLAVTTNLNGKSKGDTMATAQDLERHPQPDNSPCNRIMELQSRKQVIEEWLATEDIPDRFVGDMREMLPAIERELTVLMDQHSATKSAASNKNFELGDRRP